MPSNEAVDRLPLGQVSDCFRTGVVQVMKNGRPGRVTGAGRPSRAAISHYLNNTRPEAIADLTHGTSVNFFV